MAEIAAVIASTHHPFYYKASTARPDEAPPFAAEWVRKVEAFRETLTRAEPDVLLMVGSDHFHQLWLDNMPQFLVGHAEQYDANWYNEEREFGLPRMHMQGHRDLVGYLLRNGLDAGFDLAFSNELRIDHSVTCPIIALRPQNDLPIVPVYTNIFAPPLPQPRRFVQLGQTIRELVESWPSDQRVAIIGTGHLSLELGGPRQFGPHGPDPEFDAKAVEWIAEGDLRGAAPRSRSTASTARQRHPRVHGLHADDGRRGRGREGRLRRHLRPVPHDGGLLHLVPGGSAGMSRYLLDKFLFTVDRDPELSSATARTRGARSPGGRPSAPTSSSTARPRSPAHGCAFDDGEREALATHDYPDAVRAWRAPVPHPHALHRDVRAGPRGAAGLPARVRQELQHFSLPYPDVAT